MKQWEKLYKYLYKLRQEYELTYDQQRQWNFLAPIFEGENSDCYPDHGTSGIWQEYVGEGTREAV
jgi:hypothetical protein